MKHCMVSFVDPGGIRHTVEVEADSMFEAAAAALESFRAHACSPGLASELQVQVRTAVTHTVTLKKLKDWAERGGRSPRDTVLRRRIKTTLSAPPPLPRESRRRG
jgi:hypothetical protein